MKNLFYVLLFIGMVSSCESNTKQATKDSTAVTPPNNPSQALIKKFQPIIQGVWVKKSYIDKISQTKSPLASADLTNDITTVYINTDFIKGDSLVADAGYGNHEGGNATIKFKPGKATNSILFNGDDLTYNIQNGDTTLIIKQTIFNSNKKEEVTYIKALNTEHELGTGMYQLVNKALVAGDYTFTDSLGSISKIHFSVDGKVSGFLNFNKYEINIDLNSDSMDNLDEILFNFDAKYGASYTYKIDADTLKLYNIRANADSTEEILDKLKYKLVRQK